MKIFFILEVFALFYIFITALFVSWMWYIEIKSRKEKKNYQVEIGKALNAVRGKKTILLPFKILSYMFVADWLALGIVFVSFVWNISIPLLNVFISFLSPTLTGDAGNFFVLTLFISTAVGAKGWLLMGEIADILSDTSLHIDRKGHLDYRRRFF